MNATTTETPKALWTFTFIGGGYNQVYAPVGATLEEIKEAARPSVGDLIDRIDPSSLRCITSKQQEQDYWKTWALWD